jgi:hypothetical protein
MKIHKSNIFFFMPDVLTRVHQSKIRKAIHLLFFFFQIVIIVMESKLYKLEIKFTEVKIPKQVELSCLKLLIASGTTSNSLKFNTTGTLSLPNFSPDGILDMRLEDNSQHLAVGFVVLGRLCDKTITGDFSKWVKLEPDRGVQLDGPVKVKLVGSLRMPRRGSPAKQRPGYLSSSPQKSRGKCLYIRKLYTAEEREKEIQTVIMRVKSRLGTNYSELIEEGLKSPTGINRSPTLRKRTNLPEFSHFNELELPSRFNLTLENLSTREPLLLKHTAIGLCQRLKVLRAQMEEYQAIQYFLATFADPMLDLKQSLKETRDQLVSEEAKVSEMILKVEKEKNATEEELKQADLKLKKQEEEVNHVRFLCEEVKVHNEEFKFDQPIDKVKKRIQKLRKIIHDREEEREILLINSQKMLTGFHDTKLDNERGRLLEDKFNLVAQLQNQQNLLDQALVNNVQLEGELAVLNAQLLAEESAKVRNAALQSQKMNFSTASEGLVSDLEFMAKQRDLNLAETFSLSKKLEIDIKDHIAMQNLARGKISGKENEINTLNGYVAGIRKVIEETQSWIRKDELEFEEKHQGFLEKLNKARNTTDKVVKEIDYFSDLLFVQAQYSLIETRLHRRLTEMIDEKDLEKGSLGKIIEGMKINSPGKGLRRSQTYVSPKRSLSRLSSIDQP